MFTIFLFGCDSGCIDSTDLGDEDDIDQLYLLSYADVCSYSIDQTHDKWSEEMKNCIENTNPYSDIRLGDSHFNGLESYADTNCSSYDINRSISNFKWNANYDEYTKRSIINNIYEQCRTFCYAKCLSEYGSSSSSMRSTVSGWTKNYLKSDSNFYGIKISNTSNIKVTASGNIQLHSNSDNEKTFDFDDTYYSLNGNKETIIYPGNSNFGIINNNSDSAINIINYLRKRYIQINSYNSDFENYQVPDYSKLECKYRKTQKESIIEYILTMNYANNSSLTGTTIDELNSNFSVSNLNLDVFNNDYFYNYFSDAFNKISYENNEYKINDESQLYELTKKDNYDIYTLKIKSSSIVDGYIWNNDSTNENNNTTNEDTFFTRFAINKPYKIALKNINKANCEYTISYNDDKVLNKEIIYTSGKLEQNKWNVLKNNSREVVLNQFSNIKNNISTTVKIETTENDCSKGVYIKLLPLKEFEIDRSGYATFYIPNYNGNKGSIKYSIINPKVIKIEDTNLIKDNFYELSDSASISKDVQYFFNEISLTENFNNSTYNGFYVRKGQILRLDYSNLFKIDGKENIELLTRNVNDVNNENITIADKLGLSLPIKERPAYLCNGNGKEKIKSGYEQIICSSNGGTYQTKINTEINKDEATNNENYSVNVDYKESYSYCKINTKSLNNCNFKNKFYYYSCSEYNSNNECNKTIDSDFDFISAFSYLYSSKNCDEGNKNENIKTQNCKNLYNNLKEYIDNISSCISSINTKGYVIKNIKTGDNITLGNTPVIKNPESSSMEKYKEESEKAINSIIAYFNGSNNSAGIEGTCVTYEEKTDNDETKEVTSCSLDLGNYIQVAKDISNEQLDGLLQCYNLENYNGSLDYFKTTITNNKNIITNIDTITESGFLGNLVNLGAKKLNSFSLTNSDKSSNNSLYEGIMDTFNSPVTKDNDNGSKDTIYTYNLSTSNIGYISLFMLKDNIPMLLSNYNTENIQNTLIFDVEEVNTNGSMIEVFMARDGLSTKTLFYNNKPIDNYVLWLVKYSDNGIYDSENSMYKFNSDGKLVSKRDGTVGINLSLKNQESEKIIEFLEKKYNENNVIVEENGKKKDDYVLYFKIKDIDEDAKNNKGSYKIKITNKDSGSNFVTKIFKTLIDEITYIMDGKSFGIAKNIDNSYHICEGDTDNCYYYNPNGVIGNGEKCSVGENNCYSSCDILTSEDEFKTRCEFIYNNGGFLKLIYKNIIENITYQIIIKLCLIAMLIFYGFGYFLGLNDFSQEDLIKKIIKISVVYLLISPSGWNYYYKYIVSFFKQGIDSLLYLISSGFEVGGDGIIDTYLQRGDFTDKNILFTSGYDNLKLIFSTPIYNKILGLIFSSWFGPIYFYLVISAVISYIVALISAIIMYISAQVFMSLVLAIGPLIFFFLFFEKTKETFDKWLNILIGFALQEIFIVLTMSFFNSLIYMTIRHVFAYTVCWNSIFSINLFGNPLSLISFWKIPSGSTSGSTLNLQAAAENGPGFYNIMLFYIIGTLMGKFISSMADLASSLAGGVGINGFSGAITGLIEKAGTGAKSVVKDTMKKPLNDVTQRLDKFNQNTVKKINDYNAGERPRGKENVIDLNSDNNKQNK